MVKMRIGFVRLQLKPKLVYLFSDTNGVIRLKFVIADPGMANNNLQFVVFMRTTIKLPLNAISKLII